MPVGRGKTHAVQRADRSDTQINLHLTMESKSQKRFEGNVQKNDSQWCTMVLIKLQTSKIEC